MTGSERPPRTRWLSTWTTRRWLRVGAAASLAVLALLGITGAWVLARTESISRDLVDVRSPALTTAIRLESALLDQETGIRGYGITGTAEFIAPYQEGLTEQKTSIAQLTELLAGDRAGLADLKTVQDTLATWQERIARPIAAAPAGSPSPLAAERAAEGKKAFDEVRAALSAQQERLRAERVRARTT